MQKEIFYALALLAGAGVSVQAGANAQLRLAIGNPIITALFSFLVGSSLLAVLVLFTSAGQLPTLKTLGTITWWKWLGGVMGVIYITSVIIVAPRIGAASTFGFIVAGQLICAVIFDHFGVIGFPHHSVSLMRVLGVLLLIGGVYLIQKY